MLVAFGGEHAGRLEGLAGERSKLVDDFGGCSCKADGVVSRVKRGGMSQRRDEPSGL